LRQSVALAATRTAVDGQFFWKQKAKNYHSYLSPDQIDRFLRHRARDCAALRYDPDWLRPPPQ
jgi:hypothetical protein